MPQAWKRTMKDRRRGVDGTSFTEHERARLVQLVAAVEHMGMEDGIIPQSAQIGCAVNEFLKQVDECASMLQAPIADRSYRDHFTANYRSLLSGHQRHYFPDILMASMRRASQGFLCVNGDMHALSSDCQSKATILRSALTVLTSQSRDTGALRMTKQHFRESFRIFDEAYAIFEKEYVHALIEIEAKSRAPLVEAVNLEKIVGWANDTKTIELNIETPCGLQKYALECFLDCLSNLIAKVQLRHRRTDDKLDCEVLFSASRSCHDHGNWVTSVLANGVVHSFDALRKYLRTIEMKIEQAHPDLHLNPGLVERLSAMRQSWKLYEQWGLHGSSNKALSGVVAVAKKAMTTRPSFKEMCEDCDPDLFLVLPRIVLLCFLNDPEALQAIIKKFLPDDFCGGEDAKSGKAQALMASYWSTVLALGLALGGAQENYFDLLIQRAIVGNSHDKQALYRAADVAGCGAVSNVDSFMLELEGWSLELQRHSPEAWNTFTELFVTCVGDELPKAQVQDFRV